MRLAAPARSALLVAMALVVASGPRPVSAQSPAGQASPAGQPAPGQGTPADVVIFEKPLDKSPEPASPTVVVPVPAPADAMTSPAPAAAEAVEPVKVEDSLGVLITRRALAIAGRQAPKDDLAGIAAFYAANPDKPLWITDTALAPRAKLAIAEMRRADDWGLDARAFDVPARPVAADRTALIDLEARITLAVLKYVRHARGGRMDPTRLSEAIDRHPPLREPRRVLDELAATEAADVYLRKQHPQHPQFEKLRRLYNGMRATGAAPFPPVAEAPVEEARPRGNGSRRPAPAAAPLSVKRVLANMEQWRWMPRELGKLYVTVNLPEFTLRVVRNGQVIHTERVVAGEVDKQTPIFSQDMQSVVFHPGWGVPNSIKVNELLPGLLRGRDTLARNGLQVMMRGRPVDPQSIDWSTTDIRKLDVVQPPGPSNVLGVVKFQFPNKHDVYMHDTPSKSLFNAEVRAFSHGCMRVRNPVRLAEILFAEDQGWTPDRVTGLIRNGPQDNKVMLAHKIPVHITYFTVTVDDADKPQVFRDVYGHEPRIEMGLEGKAHLIAQAAPQQATQALARPPGRPREDGAGQRYSAASRAAEQRTAYRPGAPRGSGEWVRNVFSGF